MHYLTRWNFLGGLLALALTACTSAPVRYETEQSQTENPRAATYAIGEKAGSGKVVVENFGIAQLKGKAGRTLPAVHLALTLENSQSGSDGTWTFDIDDQKLSTRADAASQAVFVEGPTSLPRLRVGPGDTRRVAMFFPLEQNETELRPAGYSFHWRIVTEEGPVARVTRFEKQPIPFRWPNEGIGGTWYRSGYETYRAYNFDPPFP